MKNAYEESLDHLETLKRENKNLQRKSLALCPWQGFLPVHHYRLQVCKDTCHRGVAGRALPLQLCA